MAPPRQRQASIHTMRKSERTRSRTQPSIEDEDVDSDYVEHGNSDESEDDVELRLGI